MSDTTDRANVSGNGLTHLAKRLTEARIEESDRELIVRVIADLLASGEERTRLLGQVERLRVEVAEANGTLAELRDRLQLLEKERAQLTSERDAYLRAIYGLLPPPESPFTEEELSTLIHNGLSLEETIKELEAMKDS